MCDSRTFVILLFAVIGFAACSTKQVVITPLPDFDAPTTKAEALALAERHVRIDSRKNGYQVTFALYDQHERAWSVFYKRVPPKANQTAFDHNGFEVIVRSSTQVDEIWE
jgi:hypothetical protein